MVHEILPPKIGVCGRHRCFPVVMSVGANNSPISNYRLPGNYGYNSRKRRSDKAVPPSKPKSSQRSIPLIKNIIQDVFCTQKEALEFPMHHPSQSTQSTSTSCRQKRKRKESTSTKLLLTTISNEEELVGWVKSPQGQPPAFPSIKARMGPPKLRL